MESYNRKSLLEPAIYVPEIRKVYLSGPSYNPAVLVGEWFEERFATATDPKATVPAVYGKSACMKNVSVYKSEFAQHASHNSRDACKDFINWKLKGLSNRFATENSKIKFSDDVGFDQKATRTIAIRYRILPEQEALVKIEMNTSSCSTGETKTELLRNRDCRLFEEKNTPVYMTNYTENFKGTQITRDRKITSLAHRRQEL